MKPQTLEQTEAIARYKNFIVPLVNRQPTARRELAEELGVSAAYVSQILNATLKYRTPARYVPAIVSAARLSSEEVRKFAALYSAAHPETQEQMEALVLTVRTVRTIKVDVVAVDDPKIAEQIRTAVKKLAREVSAAMAQAAGEGKPHSTGTR